ncbi:MAG: PEP-CTERM sorting domain-containing protein [Planctomycetia bacterium]|nr:PEP-CTERM sorting domain-containing protein [Planctomycetia bacterium]
MTFKEELDYFAFNFYMDGRTVSISQIASEIPEVPEPATWGMLLRGIAGRYLLKRCRK